MGSGFSETALAVFTTLAPMGACSFIIIAATVFTQTLEQDAFKRLDRMTIVPILVMVAGFIGAFFHLANPMNAFWVLAGLGSSPLSNEVVIGGMFVVLTLVFWIVAARKELDLKAHKIWLGVISVCAIIFTLFCGFAYLMYTIPTWNTPWTVVQMLGCGLLGGAVLGALTVIISKQPIEGVVRKIALVQAILGFCLALLGFCMQIAVATGFQNIWGSVVQEIPGLWLIVVLLVACAAVGVASQTSLLKRITSPAALSVVCIIVGIGIFFTRIGFYSMYAGIAM